MEEAQEAKKMGDACCAKLHLMLESKAKSNLEIRN